MKVLRVFHGDIVRIQRHGLTRVKFQPRLNIIETDQSTIGEGVNNQAEVGVTLTAKAF